LLQNFLFFNVQNIFFIFLAWRELWKFKFSLFEASCIAEKVPFTCTRDMTDTSVSQTESSSSKLDLTCYTVSSPLRYRMEPSVSTLPCKHVQTPRWKVQMLELPLVIFEIHNHPTE
jgi:hypothetical protein